eukprot:3707612-Karenia_brevis.AAC.1
MLGQKKKGKTSLACIIAMCMSRYRISQKGVDIEPGYRLTQDLDFLRDQEGEIEIPVIYDDGDLFLMSAKSVKALLDMKASESKTRERY